MGKDFPHRIGLPRAILFSRDDRPVEEADNLAQRQPVGALLLHHSDRRSRGVVRYESVVEEVEAEWYMARPGRPVLVEWDAEPVQRIQHA